MNKNAKIYVAGHRGLVGSAIMRRLAAEGYTNTVRRTHAELDLCDQAAVGRFFEKEKPEYVFLAAAKVGGIGANLAYPADFIYQNTVIGFNVIHAAYKYGVKKMLNLGSSCIYPKMAPQPIREESLLSGPLEETNEAYALAKIAVLKMCAYYNRQYGTDFLSAMPANLYGPGDSYGGEGSHVLPALIRKFYEAKVSGGDRVTLWGDGMPRREFLYSDDLAAALVMLMREQSAAGLRTDAGDFVNIGSGTDLTVRELAEEVRGAVYADAPGRACAVDWDTARPNGTPRKLLDVSRIAALGWRAETPLAEGIKLAYRDFLARYAAG